jgi:hypothetical protein
MAPESPLTLEGLAELHRKLAEAMAASGRETDRRFQETDRRWEETDRRFAETDRRLQSLAGQVEALTALLRDQGLRQMALAEQQAEHQVQIRQILHRLEQHDGQFQEMLRRLDEHDVYIRRMLDILERRGGDGGPARP